MDAVTMTDLKALPQWVCYTADKVPIDPHTGRAASSNDSSTWGTAAEAWGMKKRRNLPGIGFVFTKQQGVIGVDMDDCFDGDHLKPHARDVVQCLNSYTERSPSGNGIHVLVLGEIPHSVKTAEVEIYDELRYFTVTGRQFGQAADAVGYVAGDIMRRQTEIMALFAAFGGDIEPTRLPDMRPAANNETSEADIRAMLQVMPTWGDYNSFWLPVLMAVHSAFPDERGVALCETWSPGKKGEIRRKFKSFDNTTRSGIGIGTLVHMAKEYGYQSHKPTAIPSKRRIGHQDKLTALSRA